MAYSLENTTDLSNLADAIRAKTGNNGSLSVADMATAVASITGGGGTPTLSYSAVAVAASSSTAFTTLTLVGDASKTNIWLLSLRRSTSTNGSYSRWAGWPALVIKKPNSNPVLQLFTGANSNATYSPWNQYSSISASGNNVTITFSNNVYPSDSNLMWYLKF